MGSFFNYENKVFRTLSKLVDCVLLSAMWFFLCIPIITIGASTTALYYAVHKNLRRQKGYAVSVFWEGFKSNFKRSTGMWLIQMLILFVLSMDMYVTWKMLEGGSKTGLLFFVFLALMVYCIVWIVYTCAYTARFELAWKMILKNSALIAIANLPRSVLIAVLVIAGGCIIFLVPLMLFFVPGVVCCGIEFLMERIFRKYMTEDDLAREKEEDMWNKE